MSNVVDKIRKLNKDSMDQRKFYAKIITILDTLKEMPSEEERLEIGLALADIGCQTFDEIEVDLAKVGIKLDNRMTSTENIALADFSEAVRMVDSFMSPDRFDTVAVYNYMRVGQEDSMFKEWVQNNAIFYAPTTAEELAEKISALDKKILGERRLYEEALKLVTSVRNIKDFSEADHRVITTALKSAGIQSYDKWKKSRIEAGLYDSAYTNVDLGVATGDLGLGVIMLDNFTKSYDSAKTAFENIALGPGVTKTMLWSLNSKKSRIADERVAYSIRTLKDVDTSKMNEREFFETVLSTLGPGLEPFLSREMHVELKQVLLDKGAVDYDTWKNDENKPMIRLLDQYRGYHEASLESAEVYVSNFIGDYNSARMNFEMMRTIGRNSVGKWLEASKEIGPREVQEAKVLEKMGKRQELQAELEEIESRKNAFYNKITENDQR